MCVFDSSFSNLALLQDVFSDEWTDHPVASVLIDAFNGPLDNPSRIPLVDGKKQTGKHKSFPLSLLPAREAFCGQSTDELDPSMP